VSIRQIRGLSSSSPTDATKPIHPMDPLPDPLQSHTLPMESYRVEVPQGSLAVKKTVREYFQDLIFPSDGIPVIAGRGHNSFSLFILAFSPAMQVSVNNRPFWIIF
jgi:hypothetical protein